MPHARTLTVTRGVAVFLTRSTSSPARRRVSTVALAAALTAGVAATGSLTAAPAEAAGSVDLPALRPAVQHPGAPVPVPFGPDRYVGYISDISSHGFGIYYDVVAGFNDITRLHRDILDQNLDTVVRVNTSATPEQVARAQVDAAADDGGLLSALSDAFGADLGQALRDGLAEGGCRRPRRSSTAGGCPAPAGSRARPSRRRRSSTTTGRSSSPRTASSATRTACTASTSRSPRPSPPATRTRRRG